MRPLLILASLLALAACSLPAADKESDADARALFEEIRTGADLAQDPHLAPELKTPDALAQLAAVRNLLPPGAPTKVENRSWNYQTTNDGSVAMLVHAYVYPGHTVLAETVLHKSPGQKTWSIAGFHVHLDSPPGDNRAPVTVDGPPGTKT
ncbi:MAG TPA: hypothetical protein VG939_04195 [Caulobacteraceae bacterium]|nr:hypothetical protein [Caulobacteraceae bacterium]